MRILGGDSRCRCICARVCDCVHGDINPVEPIRKGQVRLKRLEVEARVRRHEVEARVRLRVLLRRGATYLRSGL